MSFSYRFILLLAITFCCLLSCSRQNNPVPSANPATTGDPAVIGVLKQLIDSGERFSGPAARQKIQALQPAAMAAGEQGQG